MIDAIVIDFFHRSKLTIFVASLKKCGRSRLLLARKRNRTNSSNDHFINLSWYPEAPSPAHKNTVTTRKREGKAHAATQANVEIALGEDEYMVNFANIPGTMESVWVTPWTAVLRKKRERIGDGEKR
jgi:hypothetical protein